MIRVFTFALLLLISSSSFGMKRVDVPGYSFEQLTDNRERDFDPRVSPNGKIAWVTDRHLPGAQSVARRQRTGLRGRRAQLLDGRKRWSHPVPGGQGDWACDDRAQFDRGSKLGRHELLCR